ncbi:MAG: hypothetical protein ACMG57_05930 [Candidatus Dojkabacteria bacterium]
MTMLVDFQRQTGVETFDHPLLREQDLHITQTVTQILVALREFKTAMLITYQGVMGSGKTSVTKILNNELLGQSKSTLIVRLRDNREKEGRIYDRNSLELSKGSRVVTFEFGQGKQVVEEALLDNPQIGEGSVVFISEAQFMGNIREIEDIIEMLMQRGISVICDCLSHYYNGKRIPESAYISAKASMYLKLWPCDTFDENEKGDIPMRIVKIDSDGNMPDTLDRETAHYYSEMTPAQRREVFLAIANSSYSRKLVKEENGKTVCWVPSHPTKDASFVPGGNERYIPTSLATCIDILESAGLNDMARQYRETSQLEP